MRDLAQLFSAKVQKVVEDTTKKLRIVEHLQVSSLRSPQSFTCLISRNLHKRPSILPCGWIVTERVKTLDSRFSYQNICYILHIFLLGDISVQ